MASGLAELYSNGELGNLNIYNLNTIDELSKYGPNAWKSRAAQHSLNKFEKIPEYEDRTKEEAFQKELKDTALFKGLAEKYGATIEDLLHPESDYDYRRALAEGVHKEVSPHDGMMHWTSKSKKGNWLKAPNHPTAWKEFYMQQHRIDPDSVGVVHK